MLTCDITTCYDEGMAQIGFLHSAYFNQSCPDEAAVVEEVFTVRGDDVNSFPKGTVIVPRYRLLPFVEDAVNEIVEAGCVPIFHEQRLFFYKGQLLGGGFYWGTDRKLDIPLPVLDGRFDEVVAEAVSRVGHVSDYLVIDFAEFSDGRWGVVELNDACHSGFSAGMDIAGVYGRLVEAVENKG